MKKIILSEWERKEYFDFFSRFEDPVFGITSEVDCTETYAKRQKSEYSFFTRYLHSSLVTANSIKEFKYRIKDGYVVLCNEIHAGPTIARNDGSFGFSFIPYSPDIKEFNLRLQEEIRKVQETEGLRKSIDTDRINVIYYSSLPWISFTGLKHPTSSFETAGIPKITFGKVSSHYNKHVLPVSIFGHHGLLDGSHIARFLELFEQILNNC